jgi:capsular polysaccharide biosynthesis protein
MEQEIDLRPYINAVLRRWKIIVGITCLTTIAAIIYTLLQPRLPSVSANALIIPTSSRVTLDQRFVTGEAPAQTNINLQRQALLALANSNAVEEEVRKALPREMLPDMDEAGAILSMVNVRNDGDLIAFTVSAETEEQALAIAEQWGKTYADLVRTLYGRDTELNDDLVTQLETQNQRFADAQGRLDQFLQTSPLVQIDQRMRLLENLLTEAREGDQALYESYLNRARDLELIINDARTLQEQIVAGQTNVDLGTSVAALVLRGRAAGGSLPIQLNIDDGTVLNQDSSQLQSDIDRLIAVLAERKVAVLAEAEQLVSSTLSDGSSVAMSPALRTSYEQELTNLRAQNEIQQSRRLLLEQDRNIALEGVQLLQRKIDEQRIAEASPQFTVRYISATINPPTSRLVSLVTRAFLGFIAGVMLSLIVVVLLELLKRRATPVPAAGATPAPVGDKPLTN